jgi:D-alanyl-D-alanine carboxypeptidase
MRTKLTLGALAIVASAMVALPVVLGSSGRARNGFAQGASIVRAGRLGPKTRLQEIARELVAGGSPGALVVVMTPSGIHRAAAGFANLEAKARLRPSDRFRIASVTKTFVATVILQLAAERRLTLDDPVDRWLPGAVPGGASITIRELLNHTSGLFDYDEDQAWVNARISDPGREWTPRKLIAIATSHPPLFPPGQGWSYSNTNYVLLGLVIEAATHKRLAEELQIRIFRPLRLRSTSYPTGNAIRGRFAHGYLVGRPPLPFPAGTLIDVSTLLSPSAWGAGQIVSNGDDLTRFLAALMKGRLLPAAQLKAMTTEVAPHHYGLGLRIAPTRCGEAFGHDGDVPGYRNILWATVNGRRVVSIMVNVDETRVSWNTLQAAAKAALCSG